MCVGNKEQPVSNVFKLVNSASSDKNSEFCKIIRYASLYGKMSRKNDFFPKDHLTTIPQKLFLLSFFSFSFIFFLCIVGRREMRYKVTLQGI